jgi:hypothetical protein
LQAVQLLKAVVVKVPKAEIVTSAVAIVADAEEAETTDVVVTAAALDAVVITEVHAETVNY